MAAKRKLPRPVIGVILEIFHDVRGRANGLSSGRRRSRPRRRCRTMLPVWPRISARSCACSGSSFSVISAGPMLIEMFSCFARSSRSWKNASASCLDMPLRVFRKWLRGDANGLALHSPPDRSGPWHCAASSTYPRSAALYWVVVQADKCGDGANFWFFLGRCGRNGQPRITQPTGNLTGKWRAAETEGHAPNHRYCETSSPPQIGKPAFTLQK